MYAIACELDVSALSALLEPPCACAHWLLSPFLTPLDDNEAPTSEESHSIPLALLAKICEDVKPLPAYFLSE